MLQRLLVAYPTSGLRSHTFRPVEVRRALGTGHRDDSSSASRIVYLINSFFKLQSLPAYFLPWRMAASHAEDLGVARLDLLALRLHLRRISLEQLQTGKRDVLALLLDLCMKGAMRKDVDQHLLGFRAEEETLEQPCRVRIRRAAENAGWNDDQRRSFGRIHHLHRFALILQQHQIVIIAV